MKMLYQCPRKDCGHEFAADDDWDADDDDPAPLKVHCPTCKRMFDPYAAPPDEIGQQTGRNILRPPPKDAKR